MAKSNKYCPAGKVDCEYYLGDYKCNRTKEISRGRDNVTIRTEPHDISTDEICAVPSQQKIIKSPWDNFEEEFSQIFSIKECRGRPATMEDFHNAIILLRKHLDE